MRIAWFRPSDTASGDDSDHLADVIAGLSAHHDVECVDERSAHDFVWRHARGAFDLCVYELDNTARHQYMWPYLLNYSGVLALQSATVHDARRARLVHEGRQADYRLEIAFAGGPTQVRPPWHMARGHWPMLRVPVVASRLTAVADAELADDLSSTMPGTAIRLVAAGVAAPADAAGTGRERPHGLVVAVAEAARLEVAERAAGRLAPEGVALEIRGPDGLAGADIVVAVRWPAQGRPPVPALRALAAGKATIVAETHATAAWPALDPQTWRPRDRASEAPVAISIDPRDEEHSLLLALRRLATDARLRAELGIAAHAWWSAHATVDQAVASWLAVLSEGPSLPALPRPEGWPAHLDADGSRLTREILTECGLDGVDGC
jgi:hypothetical protein